MRPIVEMVGISKHFGDVVANDNVDFNLLEGEIHALIGENGAGKTTLMRILFGLYQPNNGEIIIDGTKRSYNVSEAMKLGIAMVHQNFMQIPSMSILENILLGRGPQKRLFIDYKKERRKVSDILSRFGLKIHLDTKIGTLSVGERQKIEIIKSLYLGAKILILDEPTAVLTPQGTEELFSIIRNLKSENKSIVFISHKLKEVIEIGDRITVMRKGMIIDQFQKGKVNVEEIAQAMVGTREIMGQTSSYNHEDLTNKESKKIFSLQNIWYFNDEGLAKIKDLSFDVMEGEILGIGGVEGNGQSELAKLLLGVINSDGGKIFLNDEDITGKSIRERRENGIGYISDDRMTEGLALGATIEENLICGEAYKSPFSNRLVISKKNVKEYTQNLIRDYDIRGVSQGKPIVSLSGGNLQKAILAREIHRSPRVLIASQVTRGLDIKASNFVYDLLLQQKANKMAVILISADLDELMLLSDRIIIMYEGSNAGEVKDLSNVTEEQIGLLMGGVIKNEN